MAWAPHNGGHSLSKAAAKWTATKWPGVNRPTFSEGSDPACRLALRGAATPLDEEFFALAARVYRPLLHCLEDERLR